MITAISINLSESTFRPVISQSICHPIRNTFESRKREDLPRLAVHRHSSTADEPCLDEGIRQVMHDLGASSRRTSERCACQEAMSNDGLEANSERSVEWRVLSVETTENADVNDVGTMGLCDWWILLCMGMQRLWTCAKCRLLKTRYTTRSAQPLCISAIPCFEFSGHSRQLSMPFISQAIIDFLGPLRPLVRP